MNKIQLNSVVPEIFAAREGLCSDIWHRDFGFERGKSYLIKAASGTGKSSLCSYLYGQRGDYRGTILFDGEDINITSKAGATLTLAGVKNTVKNPSKVTLGKNVNLAGVSAKWDGAADTKKSALHVENGALLIKGEGTITTKNFEIVHD